jgi:hypothetical protein
MKMIPSQLMRTGCLTAVVLAVAGLTGCGKSEDHGHDHDHGKMHVHTAPHGGTLIELGEHEANLELVRDASAGRLTGYVLDAHAENFLRIASPGFQLTADVGGKTETLQFKPVANAATGEKVGDTSQFDAQADWLKTVGEFQGTIPELTIRTRTYKDVRFKVGPSAK